MKSLTKSILTGCALTLALSLVGCGMDARYGGSKHRTRLNEQETREELARIQQHFTLDESLDAEEEGAIAYDFWRMRSFRFTTNHQSLTMLGAYYNLYGKTAEPEGIEHYLRTRLHYLVGSSAKPGADPRTVASNLSVPLWIQSITSAEDPLKPSSVRLGDRTFVPKTARDYGVVLLGRYYSEKDDGIFRISTLLHEARHSDCPNGLSVEQIKALKDTGEEDEIDEALEKAISGCGFGHPICPAGHELAGRRACDTGDGWGSYSVEIPLYSHIAKSCEDCTEEEIQQGIAGFAEASGRVLKINELLNGQLGHPELQHRGVTE